ncbi:transferase family protein [Aspergillus clavatus NRRL 1]|uniref:Transferase family protein n=1 Tax=Aspergillus clavatus (strain ATCC 1007 / CBS 513.65 / DSM 816 / NCTC 3887 / NRRL 1 / QM 1276 / 107) TaxID=344612 RepID=A1CCG4_ASPCL|nr:transferase family protein [Aspergillus clavatus NRRL 1]EAW12221.1 transferase family protein [Aspergillus clavatus NRRL 1]
MAKTIKYELSDLDKMGIMKTVKVVVFYELQPTVDIDKLISSVTEGVKNAIRQLPFMAGNVQFDGVKPYIEVPVGSELEVGIRRYGSMEHQPFSSLAQGSFSPNDADFAQFLPDEPTAQRPACLLQVSIIEGGLVLGLRVNHAAGDWVSIDTFLSLVCQSSKARQEGLEMPAYTPDLNRAPYNTPAPDPAITRQDRLGKLPIFYVMEKSQFKPPPPPPPSRSSIYKISEPAIQQLKAQCAPHLTKVDYISSYDCISALVWKSLTRARLQIHPEKTTSPSRFVHPIDVRSRDPEKKTSNKYFGNAVIGSQAGPLAAEAVVSDGDRGLAAAATLIRESVKSVNLSTIGHMTSLIASLAHTETLGSNADFTNMDFFMNTWYSGSAQKYDIGAGAVPVACRPHDTMLGSCMILPNFSRGETKIFEVLITATIEESEFLKKDAEFLKYFEPIV